LRIKWFFSFGLSSFNEFVEETAGCYWIKVYSDTYDYAPEKGVITPMILNALEGLLTKPVAKSTDTVTFLSNC
jgi:hypothetical protein